MSPSPSSTAVRLQRQQVHGRNLDIPLSRDPFQLILRDPELSPGQRCTIPPAISGSSPRPPTSGTCLETSKGRSLRLLIRCPNYIN